MIAVTTFMAALIPLVGTYVTANPVNLTSRASGPFPIENGEITARVLHTICISIIDVYSYYDALFHKNGNRCGVQNTSPPWPVKDQITWTTCQQHADEAIAPWLWALQTDRIVGMWLLARTTALIDISYRCWAHQCGRGC
jgi:hypothetical protein